MRASEVDAVSRKPVDHRSTRNGSTVATKSIETLLVNGYEENSSAHYWFSNIFFAVASPSPAAPPMMSANGCGFAFVLYIAMQ